MPNADPSAPAASPDDVAEALVQAHDLRTLGTAFAKGLVAAGRHEAAEVVRAMLGQGGGEGHGIILPGPPNPGGDT